METLKISLMDPFSATWSASDQPVSRYTQEQKHGLKRHKHQNEAHKHQNIEQGKG